MTQPSNTTTTSYTFSETTKMGPDGKPKVTTTEGFNIKPKQTKPKSKTAYTHKYTDNKFHFTNSTIENAAINNEGPVTFNTTKEHYEKGAEKKDFKISGGNFAQASLGGEATYHNKDSVIAAGSGGGVASRGDWSYDVNQAVLDILKAEVTPEEISKALLKGKKIKDMWDYVQKCKKMSIGVVFDSFLNYEEEEEMDTDT